MSLARLQRRFREWTAAVNKSEAGDIDECRARRRSAIVAI